MKEDQKNGKTLIRLTSDEFISALKQGFYNSNDGVVHSFFNSNSGTYVFEDIEVSDSLGISMLTFDQKIFVKNSSFSNIKITDCNFKEYLLFANCIFHESIYISNCDLLGNLTILNSEVTKDILYSCFNATNGITLKNSSIGCLDLRGEFKSVILTDSKCAIILLPSISDQGSLIIGNIEFNCLQTWKGFLNKGNMKWDRLKPFVQAQIILENAVCGDWHISDCDFRDTRFSLIGTRISEAFYTNVQFPDKLISPKWSGGYPSDKEILRYGYNQLKGTAQKQNDKVMFLHYQAEELRSYKSTLKLWKDWKTIFQLFSMRISNDYGTNWWRGVWFVLGFNLFFVGLGSLDKIWSPHIEGIGYFFNGFFSSLFSLISVPRYFNTDLEIIIFYISRIFIAFGIYQTIAAFRKFGKSE